VTLLRPCPQPHSPSVTLTVPLPSSTWTVRPDTTGRGLAAAAVEFDRHLVGAGFEPVALAEGVVVSEIDVLNVDGAGRSPACRPVL
jgi:hypothetical protein